MVYILIFEVLFLIMISIIGICAYKYEKAHWRELKVRSRLNQ